LSITSILTREAAGCDAGRARRRGFSARYAIAVREIDHHFVEVNGVRLHYAEQGEGPLVILLHGFPECWYSWRHQIPALADAGFRAVAPDMRGYNLSDKPKRGYDIETLVSDIVALAHALEDDNARVHLAGHDWGGVIAWQAAWRHPGLLRSLTIMNAPHPTAFARHARRSPRQVLKSSYMFFFQAPRIPEWALTRNRAAAVGNAFRRAAFNPAAFTDADLDVYREAMLTPGAATATLNYYRQAIRQGVRVLPSTSIVVPTLVLWGENDPVLGARLNDALEEWVKNVTIRHIPECGHWTQQERPGVVTDEMLDWLRRARTWP
jgi:pimeloyl-ACP methyl ester carboxylesterase